MSRPTTRAAMPINSALSGCTWWVTSLAMLPVRCTTADWPRCSTLSGVRPWRVSSSSTTASSMRTTSSGNCSSSPRRGSVLTCVRTNSVMLDLPSPLTRVISPRVAATTLPPTTSKRCSWPGMKRSTITSEPSFSAATKASRTSCSVFRFSDTPRAWLPSEGLTTTGRPMLSAASQASSAVSTVSPAGTGTPAAPSSCLVRSLSREMPSAMALVRSVSAVQMRRWAAPWPSWTRLPSFRRREGIERSAAASTMQAVLGPRQRRSTRSLSLAMTGAKS